MSEYDFLVKQGATWQWELSGFKEDISGNDFFMEIREEATKDSDLLFDVSPFLVVESNRLLVEVPSSDTKTMVFSKGFYDLFMRDSSGVVVCLLSGCVKVQRQVSDLGGD